MEAVKFEGHNAVIAEDQPQYIPLPVRHDPSAEGSPMTCCFKLSPEEIQEIIDTGTIWHVQWTFGQPFQPIRMSTQKPF